MNSLECYETDFEVALLEASGEYYKRKAAAWIQARPLLCAVANCFLVSSAAFGAAVTVTQVFYVHTPAAFQPPEQHS